jgi:hypothetical protein
MLVDAAWVDTYTLHENVVVRISVLASTANTIDGHVAIFAVTVESVDVEDFVDPAAIAMRLIAVVDLDSCRFAAAWGVTAVVTPVIGRDTHC